MFIPARAYQWLGPVFWVVPTGTIGIRARGRLDQVSLLSEKSLDPFSDRRVYSHTQWTRASERSQVRGRLSEKVRFMDELRYGHCRVSRAAARNLDCQGWNALVDVVRSDDTITVSHLDRIGRNLVEGLQPIERLTDQGVGIVTLDAGIHTSAANPAARLQMAMMPAFAEWERQTVRERSIAGQLRARHAGKSIGWPESLTESVKADIRLLHQQGRSATRLAEDYRAARSTIYKAIVGAGSD